MELVALVEYGTPVLILGLMIMVVRLDGLVRALRDDVKEMRENVVYQVTCEARLDATTGRLIRLEQLNNGGPR